MNITWGLVQCVGHILWGKLFPAFVSCDLGKFVLTVCKREETIHLEFMIGFQQFYNVYNML